MVLSFHTAEIVFRRLVERTTRIGVPESFTNSMVDGWTGIVCSFPARLAAADGRWPLPMPRIGHLPAPPCG